MTTTAAPIVTASSRLACGCELVIIGRTARCAPCLEHAELGALLDRCRVRVRAGVLTIDRPAS